MKFKTRIFILLLCLLICMSITSCVSNKDKLNALWVGTQAEISEDSNTLLDEFSIYYFHDDNKLDLGNYDYSLEDYNNNYIWIEEDFEYEWVDKGKINIKYNGSNFFNVIIKDSRLLLTSEDYSIEFEKATLKNNK